MSKISVVFAVALFALNSVTVVAQTTEFTYQGKLNDGGAPANASYDFEFRLFDSESGGAPLATQQRVGVPVAGGVFNARLDFGTSFTGQPRWLEIAVKPAGSPDPFTTLNPRQPVTSAPYGIRSLTAGSADAAADAEKLGGVEATQYVVTNDARLSDARPPTAGSTHYIQNGNSPQPASNFNITGSGVIGGDLTVGGSLGLNIVNAQTQYNIGGQRVLSIVGDQNLFAGRSAGTANTSGFSNAFVGNLAGSANTTGGNNSFFGTDAGRSNTTASGNSFFGRSAGFDNTIGSNNSFFGLDAGRFNTTGGFNSFFGIDAGRFNTTGDNNAFFGADAGRDNTASGNAFFGFAAGRDNTTGQNNSFFGRTAGLSNTTGENNSFFGRDAGRVNITGEENSFFGAFAGFSNTTGGSNSFFGRTAGLDNTTGELNSFFGRDTGRNNTTGGSNSFFGAGAGLPNTSGGNNAFFGRNAGNTNTVGSNNTIVGYNADVAAADLTYATAIGAGAVVSTSNTVVLGRSADTVQVPGSVNIAGNLTGGGVVKGVNGLNGDVTLAEGANITITPSGNTLTIASTGGGGGSLTVREQDGAPAVANVTELRVSNGTLIDNGGGSVSLATGGGGAGAILNQTSQQSSANFNIDGTGTANIFNAATHYSIGGNRVLAADGGNTFVGQGAGAAAGPSAASNSFFGFSAGRDTTTADFNSFFGNLAGRSNTTGSRNSFFGFSAGLLNTTGEHNAFFGIFAGRSNTTGGGNVFIGREAGEANTTGDKNTAVGYNADVGSPNLSHATAIGAGAVVNTSNTVQLGRDNDTVRVPGRLVVNTLGSAGSAHLCRNAAGQLAPCSSSLRYKTDVAHFRLGLNLVERLRPITFTWKDDGARDLGLGAEDVARVEPLLVTYNREGQVEGVKYDRVAVVLLNAVREQQAQIRQQQQQLKQQQLVIDGLRQLVCQTNPQAQVCHK